MTDPITPPRASGVLLHPTSLPGDESDRSDGDCGDFGVSAYRFIDWLSAAGQSLWQVLPLNPIGPGNSPYASVSAHAGSPLMVALEPLVQAGWLDPATLRNARAALKRRSMHTEGIDFEASGALRLQLLREAARRFFTSALANERAEFAHWCAAESDWLDDYTLFMAIRDDRGDGAPWVAWPQALAYREPAAIVSARRALDQQQQFWRFVQWLFARQWQAIRRHARDRGIRIIGDMPIYVAWDSADVWAHPDLFQLDATGTPTVVAGVPPDDFNAQGQRWGNPLYRWVRHERDDYAWWRARLRSALRHADIVRLDHFRGFAGYWEIQATAPTAVEGRWCAGPGRALFDAFARDRGESTAALPIVAEDLGTLTPDVIALRESLGLAGMRVLQFAFGDSADNLYLPHNIVENCALYSGTHDNDTTLGWFDRATLRERRFAQIYFGTDGREIGWDFIHAASASVARYAIYPLQDLLGLGSAARMNTPGEAAGQWGWRFRWDQIESWQGARLREISAAHGRNGLAL